MSRRNPVAKHANTYNKAATHVDRSKEPPDYDLEEEIMAAEFVECPHCYAEQHGTAAYIGSLGSLRHYRCRFCGGQWSMTP